MAFKLKTEKIGEKFVALLGPKGLPLYLDDEDNNKEVELDAADLHFGVIRNSADARKKREALEALQATHKQFEGLDADAARRALDLVKNIDDKKLVDAGKVDEIKLAATKAMQEKLDSTTKQFTTELAEERKKSEGLKGALDNEIIGGGFARSKFIGDKVAIPRSFVESKFRGRFKLENGKPIAMDEHGQPIYGKADPSNPAPFDEALEIMISRDPDRDSILKGNQSSGSGAGHGSGGSGNGKTISRSAYNALQPDQQATLMKGADRPQIV